VRLKAVRGTAYLVQSSVEAQVHAVATHLFLHVCGDRRVQDRQDPRQRLDQSDAHTAGDKRLGHLKTDVAGADNEGSADMSSVKQAAQADGVLQRAHREHVVVVETRDRRHHRRPSRGHDEAGVGEPLFTAIAAKVDDVPFRLEPRRPDVQAQIDTPLLAEERRPVRDQGIGSGDGHNRIAILDPNATENDLVIPTTKVMKEVITVLGVTPDPAFPGFPGAVREWCINTAAVDPFTKSILANSEDGKLYRWDLTSNTLSEVITLSTGIGEAYTPTVIGSDGTAYAINFAVLNAVGH